MKRRMRSRNDSSATRKVACTVSAAALMLGVSQAATVGFNFQANYCAAASYSGAIVTAPAFGVASNGWESLPQMDTGYGSCPAGSPPYTTNCLVSTSSSGAGLNPLPNGALLITWSADTANVSGFGGYDRPGPNYTFGGNGYNPGNEQVYWAFLRDGVNFGPGSSGGDNHQPGYSIDIVGLSTLFTNTPFVVQLVASADSMDVLTNAFVIDAATLSTQTVIYPSTPPVANVGDTAWIRGIGGGLSTMTPNAITTDHLQIVGNRAQHGGTGGPPTGFNNCSTIAGFIITDKPVVTMSPQPPPGIVSPGDTVDFSAYAIGVPPLHYQWRHNGVPITGANTNAYTLAIPTNNANAFSGGYDLVVTNLYGAATSAVSTVTLDRISIGRANNVVFDSSGLEHDGLNFGATWLASSTDSKGTNRTGVMSFNAATPSQITIPALASFNSPTGTIMFWMRSTGTFNLSGNGATLFDRLSGNGLNNGNGLVLLQLDSGSLEFEVAGNANDYISQASVADTNWHHIALVYDQSIFGQIGLYIDGVLDGGVGSANGGVWSWTPAQEIELGLSHDTSDYQPYQGQMDDFRIYSRPLTAAEIASVIGSNAIVDPTTLQVQLNFTTSPQSGLILTWQSPDGIIQSATSLNGPWTDVGATGSKYATTSTKQAQFYRYRGHTPVTFVTNPYLM